MNNSLDSGFEQYRRQRQRRRLESGHAYRPLGENAEVLEQLEQVEAKEVQDQRLTREVNDFFTDATRTAASIVQRVSKDLEEASCERISQQMREFLTETVRRMEHLVMSVKARSGRAGGETHLDPDMHKLVGPALDGFRCEGTAQLADKHLGQDPFAHEIQQIQPHPDEVGQSPAVPEPEAVPEEESWAGMIPDNDTKAQELDDVLADRFGEEEPPTAPMAADEQPPAEALSEPAPARPVPAAAQRRPAPAPPPAAPAQPPQQPQPEAPKGEAAPGSRADHFLLQGLGDDPERMREALKVLVKNRLMSKEEALQVYREAMALRA